MEQKLINPWQWQQALGFSQAVEVKGGTYTLYCAGMCPVDENGLAIETGVTEQVHLALDNIETVLKQAGYTLANVVRLNYYTTSIAEFFEGYHTVTERLGAAGSVPASTLLQISALAQPGIKIEIEVTAIK